MKDGPVDSDLMPILETPFDCPVEGDGLQGEDSVSHRACLLLFVPSAFAGGHLMSQAVLGAGAAVDGTERVSASRILQLG